MIIRNAVSSPSSSLILLRKSLNTTTQSVKFSTSNNVRPQIFFTGVLPSKQHSIIIPHMRCFSSLYKHAISNNLKTTSIWTNPPRRHITSGKGNDDSGKNNYETNFEASLKRLREAYGHIRSQISLDIWTLNIVLGTFIIGPFVWNSMRNSRHNADHYNIPTDDNVEHSVRILLDVVSQDSGNQTLQDIANNSPEEDVKRILNLLTSDNIRTNASKIASEVIGAEPFQNAVKKLVRNIWDDLINDEETYSQLTTLLYTVLQHEKIYSAVKDLLLQLVNDEEVNRELTKLVAKLGEEPEVLAATQQLLTESAHRTMNDPNVLDHSMEFATEVMGDDVVQRTGGDALWKTVGYAFQPSGNAVLAGVGTVVIAGVLHFYLSRRGNVGSSDSTLHLSQDGSFCDLPRESPQSNLSIGRESIFPSSSNANNSTSSLFAKLMEVAQWIVSLPSFVIGSIHYAGKALMNGVTLIFNTPSWLIELFYSVSSRVSNSTSIIFSSCLTGISNSLNIITEYWTRLMDTVLQCITRMSGTSYSIFLQVSHASSIIFSSITEYWSRVMDIVAQCISRMTGTSGTSTNAGSV